MSDDDVRIDDYLTRYAASLTAFDADGAADLWATPAMILDDRSAAVLESREAMIQGLEQSYPLYRRLGLDSVGHELLRQERLSDAMILVCVRWLFRDAAGDLMTDSTSYYILRLDDERLRACVCIETDAAEKLQALADERGIELPQQAS